jgi:hypothetical protein
VRGEACSSIFCNFRYERSKNEWLMRIMNASIKCTMRSLKSAALSVTCTDWALTGVHKVLPVNQSDEEGSAWDLTGSYLRKIRCCDLVTFTWGDSAFNIFNVTVWYFSFIWESCLAGWLLWPRQTYKVINFILLSPCIFTNSIYFTPTNAHVKPLFCSFYCKMYRYTCFDPRIIVRVV